MSELFDADKPGLLADQEKTGEYDPSVDYLSQLVGEGKKYKDLNALAFSRIKADEHIRTVEAEAEDVRKELEKRLGYEEVIRALKETSRVPTPQVPEPALSTTINNNEPDVMQKVQSLLDQKMTEYEKRTQIQKNLDLVKSELQKTWGKDYGQKLRERAAELEIGTDFLDSLASSNPRAFLKVVLPERGEAVTNVAPPKSSVNTYAHGSGTKPFKKMSEFRELLKTRAGRREYLSPRVQNEIARLEALYGDEFRNS